MILPGLMLVLCLTGTPQEPPVKPPQTLEKIALATNEGDERLSKSYSLQADTEPLGKILLRLQKQSGVTLRIEGKWIANLRTTAYTRPLPLYLLLRRLAQLHNLTWRGKPDEKVPTYTLYESFENRRYVDYLKGAGWDAFRQRVALTRQYAQMPSRELEACAQQGDWRAQGMRNPSTRAKATIASLVSENVLDELIGKRSLTLSFQQLTPQAQAALVFLVHEKARRSEEGRQLFREKGVNIPEDRSTPTPPEQYRVRYSIQGEGYNASLMAFFEYDRGAFGGSMLGEIGGGEKAWLPQQRAISRSGVVPSRRAESRKLPSDLTISATKWSDALKDMADAWKLNVFSDAYPNIPFSEEFPSLSPRPLTTQRTLEEGLNYCSQWGRASWQEGSQGNDILFRREDWYQYRDQGVTEPLMARLRRQQERNQPFALEDLAELAGLSASQTVQFEKALNLDLFILQQSREVMGLYRTLDAGEKKLLLAQGLTLDSLAGPARGEFVRMLQAVNANVPEPVIRTTRLRLALEKGQSRLYLETRFNDDNLRNKEWRFFGIPRSEIKQ